MKRLLFCFIAIVAFFINESSAQSYPTKHRSIALGFGPRSLDTDPGMISSMFVDNSPSMDNFSSIVEVEDEYNRLGFNLAINFGRYKGLSHSFAFDVSLGEHKGGLFYYSLGYSIPLEVGSNILIIRPNANIGFGNFGFNVGEIENNAAYIQIGEKQYFSSSLDLLLESQTTIYGPALDLRYIIGGQFEVFGNVALDIASSNNRPSLVFIAPSSSEEGQSSVDIDGTNPLVTYNGSPITSLPYDASGLRVTIGVGYVWGKD